VKKTTLIALLCAGLLATACSLFNNKVTVSSTNFGEEIELVQNLRFTFNRNVADSSRIGSWDSTRYVQFDPPVAGRFKWTAPDELIFSPSTGFLASTDYSAKLTDAIEGASSKKVRVDDKDFAFHTPYLDIKNGEIFWTRDDGGKLEGRINLKFNYDVDPKQVAQLLEASVQDKAIKYEITTAEVGATMAITLPASSLTGIDFSNDVTVLLKIAPGLNCKAPGSKWASRDPLKYEVVFPQQGFFGISNVEATHTGERGTIRVYTTQALPANRLQGFVSIDPSVSYTVQPRENGFEISGPFNPEESYTLKISGLLADISGKKLGKDYEQNIVFGELGESIQMVNRGTYLSSKGERNVALRIINVPALTVTVHKIYENNLIAFMRQGSRWDYDYEGGSYNSYTYYDTEPFGDLILSKDIETRNLPKVNGVRVLSLDFTDKRKDYKGIYLVSVTSKDKRYLRANKLIALSDIGLIARQGGGDLWVWANGILDGKPMKGLKLGFISSNNQTMYTAVTDGDGHAVFKDMAKTAPDFRAAMITAANDDDFTYLMLDQSRVETSRFDVGGKNTTDVSYDAYLYGDREIYRPGDTIYVNGVVRKADRTVERDMPVSIKLRLPNGNTLDVHRGTLNAQGAFETSFVLPASAVTGSYSLTLRQGDDDSWRTTLANKEIGVEEFVPDRIKVEAKMDKEAIANTGKAVLRLQANNMYGPPAALRNYEVELTLRPKNYSHPDFADYDFSLNNEAKYENVSRTGRTDGQGQVVEAFDNFSIYNNVGILQGRVLATVFDETNRPVNRARSFDVITQPVLFGLQDFDRYCAPNLPLKIGVVGIEAATGKVAQNAQARVQLVKLNWDWLVERDGSSYRYVTKKREQLVSERVVGINGKSAAVEFTPNQSGEYEVRLYKPGATVYVARSFWSYGYGYTNQNTTFEVDPEGQVILVPDKAAYNKGDKATILLKTPFEGTLLVTYERDRVYKHEYVKTEKNAATVTLSLTDDHVPNVYVTATLFRPMGAGQLPLTVGHGFVSLKVEDLDKKLPVEITAAETSTSRRKQTVSIKTRPGAEVTVAVVDEGILQIKNTQSPNPYEYFFRKHGLGVMPYDIYAMLLPEISKNPGGRSSAGGDGFDQARRVNPLNDKRIKLVSYWSGIGKADGNGVFNYTFNIPQFAGALRIMAVAYDGNRFGAGAKEMKVADPVVIATALPRFLSPRDTVEVPVTLTNTTKTSASAQAKISVSGPLKVLGSSSQSAQLPAGGERRVSFKLAAANGYGSGKISLDVAALGGNYNESIDISIRPASSLIKANGSGVVMAGQSANIDLTGSEYMAASRQSKLLVSKSPVMQFAKDLNYLLGYPHGCIEQTVSKAFPQLYYQDLVKSLRRNAGPQRLLDPSYDIKAAIGKIQSMQLGNGGISYWPGDKSEANWWGSVFAAHFLWEAKRAGYDVNETALDRVLGYLKNRSNSRETMRYWYGNGYSTYAAKEIFYSLFVLALAGRSDVGTMNYYKARPEVLTADCKYMLAAAYALVGDPGSFNYLLPGSIENQLTRAETGGSFSSPIRDKGIALYVLLEADPANSQVPALARSLSESMRKEYWLNTQESVFGFLALGRFAQATAKSGAGGTITANGKAVAEFTGPDLELTQPVNGQRVAINATGGNLYYFWETSGIDATGKAKEEDTRLRVRKAFYNRNGTPLGSGRFNQGELVVVKLTVTRMENETIENVVVTDLLPAGFEIENPRISELPDISWANDADAPLHMDVRDDRINFYTHLNENVKHYYYVVRAVSPGVFNMGPASADAMYNGEYHSTNGAGVISITSQGTPTEQ
jgi:uncharacterized protein YfaS (alpha-2-macroglobulin family)